MLSMKGGSGKTTLAVALAVAHERTGGDRRDRGHGSAMLGFGKKERAWNDRGLVRTWREEWAAYSNRALDAAGRSERIDHRSLEAQR